MEKICLNCKKEFEIEKFIPKNKDGTNKFDTNKWFFAYCKCDCSNFIVEREYLEEGWIPIEEKLNRKLITNETNNN